MQIILHYSQTCIKRSPLGQRKSKEAQFTWNFIWQSKKKCDLLIQLTAWAGLNVIYYTKCLMSSYFSILDNKHDFYHKWMCTICNIIYFFFTTKGYVQYAIWYAPLCDFKLLIICIFFSFLVYNTQYSRVFLRVVSSNVHNQLWYIFLLPKKYKKFWINLDFF